MFADGEDVQQFATIVADLDAGAILQQQVRHVCEFIFNSIE